MANKIDFTEANKGIVTRFTIAETRHDPRKCRHCNFELDSSTRTVECKDCGAIVDAFDVLMEYALNERAFIWKVSRAKAAIEEWEKIQAEWTPTQRERRRVEKARQWAKRREIDADG